MIELLDYLSANGFTSYIASGGDRDFMRPVAGDLYGIPPERVIGSALGLTYQDTDGESRLLYKSAMEFFDDGPEKPVRIWSRIGRRPILSVGNSNGDLPMLAFSGLADRPALRLLLHDDADLEFDYVTGQRTPSTWPPRTTGPSSASSTTGRASSRARPHNELVTAPQDRPTSPAAGDAPWWGPPTMAGANRPERSLWWWREGTMSTSTSEAATGVVRARREHLRRRDPGDRGRQPAAEDWSRSSTGARSWSPATQLRLRVQRDRVGLDPLVVGLLSAVAGVFDLHRQRGGSVDRHRAVLSVDRQQLPRPPALTRFGRSS